MIATLLAVTTLGVAAVNASCPDRYTAYYNDRVVQCEYSSTVEGQCWYHCVTTRYHFT